MKIEKNIPIPEKSSGWGLSALLRSMEVGDSVFVSGKSSESVRNVAAQCGRRSGLKFVTKSFEDGVRVWRAK